MVLTGQEYGRRSDADWSARGRAGVDGSRSSPGLRVRGCGAGALPCGRRHGLPEPLRRVWFAPAGGDGLRITRGELWTSGSLAEMVGDAALTFDPDRWRRSRRRSSGWSRRESPERLRGAGLSRAAEFTWRRPRATSSSTRVPPRARADHAGAGAARYAARACVRSSPGSAARTAATSPSCFSKGLRGPRPDPRIHHGASPRLPRVRDACYLHSGDLLDSDRSRTSCVSQRAGEIYHLAGTSFVANRGTAGADGRVHRGRGGPHARGCEPGHSDARFYQASSLRCSASRKKSRKPRRRRSGRASPYGSAKCYAHFAAVNYREGYGLFAASGILYNHESPRRPLEFVTRKITHSGGRDPCSGQASELVLGNLDAERDWGYARITSRRCGSCSSRTSPTTT